MAKNTFKDILNKELTEENQKLSNDLKLYQKKVEFLENYRKVLNQFKRNCVCDQNKITTFLFRSLERQYKQLCQKETKHKSKTKTSATNVANVLQNNRIKKVSKLKKNSKRSELTEETTPLDQQIIFSDGSLLKKLDKTIDKTNDLSTEQSYKEQTVECHSTLPLLVVQQEVDVTSSVSNVEGVGSSLKSTIEDDSDLTFPSFNCPIFSMNASYVEELAAQVVPKINVQTAHTINKNTNNKQNDALKPEPKGTTSGQTFPPDRQTLNFNNNSDEISGNLNIKFVILMENLKNGRLKSFNDPNNDMISVFLKDFDLIDGKKVSKIIYKCNYSFCGFETNSHQYIHRHIDRHKTSKLFRSSLIKFRTFSLLLEDLKSGKLESFIDPDYDSVLVTLKRSDSYEDQNQLELIYKCLYPNCHFETYGKYYIRSHVLRHNKNKTFVCNVCQEKFGSKVCRVEHQIRVHNNCKNRLFKCEFPECSYKTTVRQSMEFHKMKHKSEKTFKCETIGCDLYFKNVYQMKNHMKRVHVLKTVVCEWPGCEAKFKTKYELQHHILSHTGQKITVGKIRDILKEGNFVSTVDKNNKLFSVIRQQIISESDGQVEIGPKLGYKCNYGECKFICITPHLISEHTLSHSMGKAFECDLCHKTYTLRNHLNNHKKLVHNINNKCPVLKCGFPQCDYTTRNPYCFKQHERTHQTDTPFKCSEDGCDKSFKTKVSLKQHINNSHSSFNLLACNWPGCKSSFKSKNYLNYHMKCHSKPKETYQCQHCVKSFNFKTNLTKHSKSQHNFE